MTGRVSIGARLQKAIETRAEVERRPRPILAPQPSEFLDVTSGEWNGSLTPGRMAKLQGKRLKIDLADETQGVFFVAEDGTRTRATMLAENYATKLIFLVPPELAPGDYRLLVKKPAGESNLRHDLDDIVLTA